jgi:hypothetical protein
MYFIFKEIQVRTKFSAVTSVSIIKAGVLNDVVYILWRVSPCAGTVESRSIETGMQQ